MRNQPFDSDRNSSEKSNAINRHSVGAKLTEIQLFEAERCTIQDFSTWNFSFKALSFYP